jgi:hypothetical protein
MSQLILPKRGTLSAHEMKLTAAAIMCASYARMMDLGSRGMRHETLTAEDERDLKRLMQWYANLGVDNKDKLDKWIHDFSRDTEDISGKAGRKAIKKVSEWNTAQ